MRGFKLAGALALLLVAAGVVSAQNTGGGGITGFGSRLLAVPYSLIRNGIAAVSSDGFTLRNNTAATVGTTVQMSPRLKWCGNAWNSVGVQSEIDCFILEVKPVTAAGTTTAQFNLSSSINNGAYAQIAQWLNGGTFANAGSIFVTGAGNGFGVGNIGVISATPSISSGFGTSPSVTSSNGSATFRVNVGTGGVATSGVIAMNTSAGTGWNCQVVDITNNTVTRMTASNTTTVTVTAAAAWAASDILALNCWAY